MTTTTTPAVLFERLAAGLHAVLVDGKSAGTARRYTSGARTFWRCERADGSRIGWNDPTTLWDAVERIAQEAR